MAATLAMREYYIRREGDEDSSGPFDIDQIASLIEAEKLEPSAYFYDIEAENWVQISSNKELMDTLFPQKRKLSLLTPEVEEQRKKEEEEAKRLAAEKAAAEAAAEAEGENASAADGEAPLADTTPEDKKADEKPKKKKKGKKDPDSEEPEKLEVTRMLALAEGRADDPSGKSPRERQAAVAFFGLRFLTLFFIASIAAMVYIERDLVVAANAIAMAKSPYLIIAAFDLLMTVFLLLQVTEIYPLLRFRAAVGAGLLTILFYAADDPILVLANLLLTGAIYFCSAIIKIRYLIISSVAGVLGILGYVYVFFLK